MQRLGRNKVEFPVMTRFMQCNAELAKAWHTAESIRHKHPHRRYRGHPESLAQKVRSMQTCSVRRLRRCEIIGNLHGHSYVSYVIGMRNFFSPRNL